MAEQVGMTEGMSEREKFIRGAQFCIHDEDAGNYLIGVIDVIREDRNSLRSENAAKDEEIARLGFAVRNVMEATGITLDNPSGDLADELANVMQAFIMDKSNDVKAVQAQLAQARRIPGCPEGMRVVKIGPLVFSDRGDIRQAWLEPSEEGAASQFHYDVSRDASGSIKFQINESDIPRAFHPLNAAENKGSTSPVSAEARFTDREYELIDIAQFYRSHIKAFAMADEDFRELQNQSARFDEIRDGLEPSEPAETPKVRCPKCKGTGSIPNGTDEMACGFCTGSGQIDRKSTFTADELACEVVKVIKMGIPTKQNCEDIARAVARALGCEDRIEEDK